MGREKDGVGKRKSREGRCPEGERAQRDVRLLLFC